MWCAAPWQSLRTKLREARDEVAEAHAQRQRVESGGGAGARALAEAEAQLRVLRKKQYEGNRRVTVTRALWLPLLARSVSLCLTLRMLTRTHTGPGVRKQAAAATQRGLAGRH